MRIVLKPAGLIIVIAMIGVLATIAYVKNRTGSLPAAARADTSSPPNTGESPAAGDGGNMLKNPGFEESTEAPPVQGQTGRATGKVGTGWIDNSQWAPLTLDYAVDSDNPHSGHASQRLEILSMKDGRAQFVQQLKGNPGSTYHASVWVRSSEENTSVQLMLRQANEPYKEYKATSATVGKNWQKLEVEGTVTDPGDIYVMTAYRSPNVKLWIDDATLEAVK